ncbi:hypothetical protein Q7C36_017886 [Tachysurus vachellii]|uniref:Uncharacterized protein n=1 Tax=Tachysurus vachellii TaxID=175792 RepID=A0AA88S2J9_TACVA|nr:hypothetical protein Q7C36_017886 [Tachysurus vachellii]
MKVGQKCAFDKASSLTVGSADRADPPDERKPDTALRKPSLNKLLYDERSERGAGPGSVLANSRLSRALIIPAQSLLPHLLPASPAFCYSEEASLVSNEKREEANSWLASKSQHQILLSITAGFPSLELSWAKKLHWCDIRLIPLFLYSSIPLSHSSKRHDGRFRRCLMEFPVRVTMFESSRDIHLKVIQAAENRTVDGKEPLRNGTGSMVEDMETRPSGAAIQGRPSVNK